MAFLARDLPFDAIGEPHLSSVLLASCVLRPALLTHTQTHRHTHTHSHTHTHTHTHAEFVRYEQLRIFYLATLASSAVGAHTSVALTGLDNSLIGAVAGCLTGALTTPLGLCPLLSRPPPAPLPCVSLPLRSLSLSLS